MLVRESIKGMGFVRGLEAKKALDVGINTVYPRIAVEISKLLEEKDPRYAVGWTYNTEDDVFYFEVQRSITTKNKHDNFQIIITPEYNHIWAQRIIKTYNNRGVDSIDKENTVNIMMKSFTAKEIVDQILELEQTMLD